MFARIVCNVAAIPHAGNHIGDRTARGCAIALRQLPAKIIAGKENGTVAMIITRHDRVVGDECEDKARKYSAPTGEHAPEPQYVGFSRRIRHKPESQEK